MGRVDRLAHHSRPFPFSFLFPPAQHVIDGDLCEAFTALAPAKQKQLAADLTRAIGDVAKKLEEQRAKLF